MSHGGNPNSGFSFPYCKQPGAIAVPVVPATLYLCCYTVVVAVYDGSICVQWNPRFRPTGWIKIFSLAEKVEMKNQTSQVAHLCVDAS